MISLLDRLVTDVLPRAKGVGSLACSVISNKSFEDILLREELGEYADEHPDRFKLWHVLSSEPEDKNFKVRENKRIYSDWYC